MKTIKPSILIIGGGPTGLVTLKELKAKGFDPILFEYSNDIGGQWNLNNPHSCAYPTMTTNGSIDFWFWSDYPWFHDKTKSHYGSPMQMQNFMKSYAKHFNLYDNIVFNRNVINTQLNESISKWEVSYQCLNGNNNNNNNNNITKTDYFDKLVVCTGAHVYRKMPSGVDYSQFKGKIYHSDDLSKFSIKDFQLNFNDKHVLMVGGAITGVDQAENILNLCHKTKTKITLLYRNKFVFFPLYVDGKPIDGLTLGRREPLIDIFDTIIDIKKMSKYGFYAAKIEPNATQLPRFGIVKLLPKYIENGKCSGVYGNIIKCVNKEIFYESLIDNKMTRLDNIDAIVFATGHEEGYKMYPFLSNELQSHFYNRKIHKFRRLLYMNTIVANPKYQNNLAFVGANNYLKQWVHELCARFIAGLWTDAWGLPSIEEQKKWIKEVLLDIDPLPFFNANANFPFADIVAEYIGVLPKEKDFPNKEFYKRVMSERAYGTQFRIVGPGKMDNALEILEKQMKTSLYDTPECQKMIQNPLLRHSSKL